MKFLSAISQINDACILDITHEKLTALIATQDNTLILSGEYVEPQDFATTLNVPNLKKLIRVLEAIETPELVLDINSNNLEYRGKRVKFKYHVHEDGILVRPALKIEKIKAFTFDIATELQSITIQQLLKGTAFASDTTKVYFYTKNGNLTAELTDKARHNTDSYALELFPVDFTLQPLPINVDNLRFLELVASSAKFQINTKIGALSFEFQTPSIKLLYIVTSLIS